MRCVWCLLTGVPPGLSDSVDDCGFDITVNDDRQSLSSPVQPEVFLHLTESLAQV
jgi:Fe-S cluster assembly protein SufD